MGNRDIAGWGRNSITEKERLRSLVSDSTAGSGASLGSTPLNSMYPVCAGAPDIPPIGGWEGFVGAYRTMFAWEVGEWVTQWWQ